MDLTGWKCEYGELKLHKESLTSPENGMLFSYELMLLCPESYSEQERQTILENHVNHENRKILMLPRQKNSTRESSHDNLYAWIGIMESIQNKAAKDYFRNILRKCTNKYSNKAQNIFINYAKTKDIDFFESSYLYADFMLTAALPWYVKLKPIGLKDNSGSKLLGWCQLQTYPKEFSGSRRDYFCALKSQKGKDWLHQLFCRYFKDLNHPNRLLSEGK